jgi:hypothetical protein
MIDLAYAEIKIFRSKKVQYLKGGILTQLWGDRFQNQYVNTLVGAYHFYPSFRQFCS